MKTFESSGGWSYADVIEFLQGRISGAEEDRGPDTRLTEVIHYLDELHLSWQMKEDLIRSAVGDHERPRP